MTLTLFEPVTRSARFSADRRYRYELAITWGDPEHVANFLMLNPSTADEYQNDPTVERCERRARKMGYDGLVVTNLFAFRATDPKDMLTAPEPIGPENDEAILAAAGRAALIVCAWGKDREHRGRASEVVRLLAGRTLHALKVSESTGQPWHPLYLGYQLVPQVWTPRRLS
jgi:hypothetical protein